MDKKMRSINFAAVVITFVLYASNSSAQQIARPSETMGEFTANTSVNLIHSWLSYCSEKFPDLKNVLESEFSLFKSKHMEAIKPIMERLASNPDFNEPVPDNTRDTFNKIGDSIKRLTQTSIVMESLKECIVQLLKIYVLLMKSHSHTINHLENRIMELLPNLRVKCDKHPANNFSFVGVCDYGFIYNFVVGACALRE
jgi:hypothetical protein